MTQIHIDSRPEMQLIKSESVQTFIKINLLGSTVADPGGGGRGNKDAHLFQHLLTKYGFGSDSEDI